MKDYRPYAKRLAALLRDAKTMFVPPGTPFAIQVGDALIEEHWDRWPDVPEDETSAATTLAIVQAAVAGHTGLPLDSSWEELLTALRSMPRHGPGEHS